MDGQPKEVDQTGKSYGNLIRIAEDREKFTFMTVNVLKALDRLC